MKPATIMYADGSDDYFEHVDPHDGYVFVRDGGNIRYIPWNRIHEVRRENYGDAP